MAVTELIFPSFRQEPQVLAQLRQDASEIFAPLSGVDGLQAAFRGTILEEDGVAIDPATMRTVLVLDWSDRSSFHSFFPKSPEFERFIQIVKPLATAPAVPELYEAHDRSLRCTTSEVTQIIKAQYQEGTERTWQQLMSTISKESADKASFYHAKGIEKDEGTFLGLIGWSSLEQYDKVGKTSDILRQISDLSRDGKVHNVVAKLGAIDSSLTGSE